MFRMLLGDASTARGKQNRIIWLGLGFAMLSQYVFLLPIAYGEVICCALAIACAVVVLFWKAVEWLT